MNMFRSLFFVAVATVVVSGSVSAIGVANMGKPGIAVPVLLIASQSKHLNNNTKNALHAAVASSVGGRELEGVVATFAISKTIGEVVDSSYGQRVVAKLPAQEYTETWAWLRWIGNIFVSVCLGDQVVQHVVSKSNNQNPSKGGTDTYSNAN